MQTLELFAGCGGLAKGLANAGFRHVGLLEVNRQACESLRANFPAGLVRETDVRTFDFTAFTGVEVVSGGPPCQPFSLGGLAKAHEDERDLFPQAVRAVADLKPKAFVFENVKGLLRAKFAAYFNHTLMSLEYPDCRREDGETWECHSRRLRKTVRSGAYTGVRYRVWHKLLNAADYGVPQIRERVFIVGLREDLGRTWTWPKPTYSSPAKRISVATALADVPDPRAPGNTLPDHVFMDGARVYPGHTGSDVSKPSKTIKAGAHGVPGGENMLRFKDGSVRYMTVHEAKLIQSFPTDFRIAGAWGEAMRQIGNAVPVKLAETVGRHLHRILSA